MPAGLESGALSGGSGSGAQTMSAMDALFPVPSTLNPGFQVRSLRCNAAPACGLKAVYIAFFQRQRTNFACSGFIQVASLCCISSCCAPNICLF